MTLTHRIVIWLGLLLCAVLVAVVSTTAGRAPAVGPPTGTTWVSGDGDLVVVHP